MNLGDADVSNLQKQLDARYGCFNIPIPYDDPTFKNRKCMGFSRSSTVPAADCRLGERSPINKLTSFIDGSMVYGSTDDQQLHLRSFKRGLLAMQDRPGRRSLLPQQSGQGVCNAAQKADDCFVAGDDRVNEQPGLTSLHTVLAREHNRVAAGLHGINPTWDDETVFQEARRIVTAEIQHITFHEFLPIILGNDLYRVYDLKPRSKSTYYYGYNDKVDSTVRTEFSSVAYRFGHTLIRDAFTLKDGAYNDVGSFELRNHFFKPDLVYNQSVSEGSIIRGLIHEPAEKFDHHITTQVMDHLFETGGHAPLDLQALNIQRARDHGIPSYVHLRKAFGMTVPSTFDDLKDTHDQNVIESFKKIYADVRDIDGFPGGVSERSLRGAVLGPFFAKVIATQYKLAKTGDRFYYENHLVGSRFITRQLTEIKKATLSRLLCDNADIQSIQPNAFLVLSASSRLTSCSALPVVDLAPWKAGSD